MTADDLVPLGVSAIDVALFQLLETELARAEVYRAALRCNAGDPRSAMFELPIEEAELHAAIAATLLEDFGLDPGADAPARLPIRTVARSMVDAMEQACALLDEATSWSVAGECVAAVVTQAERRWAFVQRLATLTQGAAGDALRAASRELGAPAVPRVRWSVPRPRTSPVREFVLRPGAPGRRGPVHPEVVGRGRGTGSRRSSRQS